MTTTQDRIKVSPRVNKWVADSIKEIFGNLNAGLEYVLPTFIEAYTIEVRTLLKAFNDHEQKFIKYLHPDKVNWRYKGTILESLRADSPLLDIQIKLSGCNINKWMFIDKIRSLSYFSIICLEIWGSRGGE